MYKRQPPPGAFQPGPRSGAAPKTDARGSSAKQLVRALEQMSRGLKEIHRQIRTLIWEVVLKLKEDLECQKLNRWWWVTTNKTWTKVLWIIIVGLITELEWAMVKLMLSNLKQLAWCNLRMEIKMIWWMVALITNLILQKWWVTIIKVCNTSKMQENRILISQVIIKWANKWWEQTWEHLWVDHLINLDKTINLDKIRIILEITI